MDSNVIECGAERDRDPCGCEGGPTLGVLKEVQKAYEERMEVISRVGGSKKLQMQVEVLQSWVNDLMGQNTLLAQTVEELETEVTTRLLLERRKYAEIECELRSEVGTLRRQLARKDSDLRGLLEVLRRLRQFDYCAIDGIHFNEVTQSDIFGPVLWEHSNLDQGDTKSGELKQEARDKSKMICDKVNEMKMLNDSLKMENVSKEREIRRLNKDIHQHEQTIMSLRNELSMNKYQAPDIPKSDAEVLTDACCLGMQCGDVEPVKEIGVRCEDSVCYEDSNRRAKSSPSLSVLSLREENVSLRNELHMLRGVLAALDEQCRVADLRARFKDEVILEMRRQLRQAKAKAGMVTSTPNTSQEIHRLQVTDSDIAITERSPSPPLLISDPSISDTERSLIKITEAECDCGRHLSLTQVTAKHSGSTKKTKPHVTFDREATSSSEHGTSNAQESTRAASVDSAASDATHIRSLENKLHATMQILKNKEETIRVQSESLALAEARIAALSSKGQALPKIHQTQQTSLFKTRNSGDGNHVEMTNVSCTAQIQEVDHTIVKTLRDNLSMIEELYRECFYETAKQEELITVLRRSYLDMRLEKKRCDQTSLVWQRNSIEKYQDIALEVERLKSEITNFLNNSTNNDSGVWGWEEGAGDAAAELRAVAALLRRLRALLDTECTCGLEEENARLKKLNETVEIQVGELRQRVTELEEALEGKEDQEQRYQLQITEKEQKHIRQQLFDIEQSSRERVDSCDSLTLQVKDLEELLNDKTVELFNVQHQCESQEVIIKQLRDELQKAEAIAKDNVATRAEIAELSEQVRCWRSQLEDSRGRLRALDAQLRRARAHCRRLADLYQEKAELASELQSQLYEAQKRGASLCAQAQRALCGVRHWLRVQRDRHAQQEEKIKQQELLIRSFQSHNSNTESASDNEPCCSRYLHEPKPSNASRVRTSETASSSYLNETRRYDASSFRTSETCPQFIEDTSRVRVSETTCSKCARVSETDSPSPPTPPVRLLRKKSANGDRVQSIGSTRTREAGVQRPQRRDAATARALSREHIYFCPHSSSNELSPPEELLERVERAHAALADARRRWRGADPRA